MKNKYYIILLLAMVFGLLIGAALIYRYYQVQLKPNVSREVRLYIPTGATYQQVLDSARKKLINIDNFDKLARRKGYQNAIKPGRYTLKAGENNQEILERLISGKQDEIAIRIGNYNSIYQLAGKISPFLESDSLEILTALLEAPLSKDYDTLAKIYWLMPNTYYFHWNTSGNGFVSRMQNEYDKFWTAERKALLQQSGKSEFDVITLASIVQLESSKADEQPKVAALYLNRLKIGMKLDADPTVVFIKKMMQPELKIQRVYYKDLKINSPYNTYLNKGLPPGPICMPNPSAIDAVLKPDSHDYLYFVADPSKPGYHLFAETLAEHENNAKIYRKWLNENKIN